MGHIKKQRTELDSSLEYWRSEVERRTTVNLTSSNTKSRKDVQNAQIALSRVEAKRVSLKAEEKELEERATFKSGEGEEGLTEFLGNDLSGDDWNTLDEAARDNGYESRSAYVRELLQSLPTIVGSASEAGKLPVKGAPASNWGRRPTQGTQGGQGSYERHGRGVRVTRTELERLEKESALFGISRSDYVRCLLLGDDPRKFGHHVGSSTAEDTRKRNSYFEESNGVGALEAQAWWHDHIRAIRRGASS